VCVTVDSAKKNEQYTILLNERGVVQLSKHVTDTVGNMSLTTSSRHRETNTLALARYNTTVRLQYQY
jgi:hypothetical protein